jgi:hypothetical protein
MKRRAKNGANFELNEPVLTKKNVRIHPNVRKPNPRKIRENVEIKACVI